MAALPSPLDGFDPDLILVLNLFGTFVFGLSGGMAAVRARFDLFGALALAVVVGVTGGIVRDLLIGIPPAAFRESGYLAAAGAAGLVTILAHPELDRLQRPIDVLDAGGLSLFCVTGSAAALVHGIGPAEAAILGAITGIGGGMLRDILVGMVPAVLRAGLYAVPALVGAAIVVAAYEAGARSPLFPIVGALVCFSIRMVGLRFGVGLPLSSDVAITSVRRSRRRRDDE